jgi:LacI family transcriptional regulator, repressor for deo operon, udp, cdd, tsx, nupC, and nupG
MPPARLDELAAPFSTTKLTDVAKLAGVSVSTASRALTRPEMVSPDTREAVQKAAKSVGYHPNLVARSLRTQSTKSVFVLLPSLASPFYPEIIRGLDWAAHERGYTLMLGLTGSEPGRQSSYVDIVHRSRADGMVVLDSTLTHMLAREEQMRIPVVQVLERPEGSTIASVTIDEHAAARSITEHLIGLGHKRIAHISGRPESTVTVLRAAGYRSALEGAGIAFDAALVSEGNFQASGGADGIARFMALAEPPTAVFCANDETAFGAIARLFELGRKVPGDVSIAGFDDIEQSAQSAPPLTTVRQPRFDIGVNAMVLLLDIINSRSDRPLHIEMQTDVVVRQSTAAPRSRSA